MYLENRMLYKLRKLGWLQWFCCRVNFSREDLSFSLCQWGDNLCPALDSFLCSVFCRVTRWCNSKFSVDLFSVLFCLNFVLSFWRFSRTFRYLEFLLEMLSTRNVRSGCIVLCESQHLFAQYVMHEREKTVISEFLCEFLFGYLRNYLDI